MAVIRDVGLGQFNQDSLVADYNQSLDGIKEKILNTH